MPSNCSNISEKDPLMTEAGYGTAVGGESSSNSVDEEPEPLLQRVTETLKLYWHLGFIAFGGPTAHVAILRDHLVRVHNFIEEDVFMELFALGTVRREKTKKKNISDCHIICLFLFYTIDVTQNIFVIH